MRIDVAGLTHVGMKRNHNEDSFLMLPDENLFVVADGMGGHASGEIASRIAVEELAEFFKMTAKDQDATWPYKMDRTKSYDENRLSTGIKLANLRIFEQQAQDQRLKGMGTTVVGIYFAANQAFVGHVGDSRVYFYSQGDLKQVTEDHSLLNETLKSKKLKPEEIENFPLKNVIVRALGMKDLVQVDVSRVEPKEGDLFLLCSDGLSGMVPDPTIAEVLSHTKDLKTACSQLIDMANANGGTDNVTCIIARYHAN